MSCPFVSWLLSGQSARVKLAWLWGWAGLLGSLEEGYFKRELVGSDGSQHIDTEGYHGGVEVLEIDSLKACRVRELNFPDVPWWADH